MKTYKLIIELSDSILEKMASIEEASNENNLEFAIAKFITSMALKKKLEEDGSMTVNMDAVVDDKELNLIKQAVLNAGAVGIVQKVHATDKKNKNKRL